MKTKIIIEVDEKDVLEESVRESLRAFARQVAREEVNKEITKEVERICKSKVDESKKANIWGRSVIGTMVSNSVKEHLQEMCNRDDFIKSYTIQKAEEEVQKHIAGLSEYARTKIDRYLNEHKEFYDSIIVEEIKNRVPADILKTVVSVMGASKDA